MAKLFASETAFEVATEAMRIHGGVGYTTDCPVERYFRDAPLMIIGEGTNEIQRLVIARGLLARLAPASSRRDRRSSRRGGATQVLDGQERYCRPSLRPAHPIRGTT